MDNQSIFKRCGLTFYATDVDALINLPEDDLGRIFGALLRYAAGQEPPELDPMNAAVVKLLIGRMEEVGCDG